MIKNNIKMKLSIIIVHYKNQEKLIQCLNSINQDKIKKEVILIDNNSNDNIYENLNKYDNIIYIKNKKNIGFAKACNQGIIKSTGNHILFLNPDTIIPEKTLEYCLKFYRKKQKIGFLGIKMLNSNGEFLKESIRGIPDPFTAAMKIFKINILFSKSRIINKYYLGNTDKEKNQKTEIVAGAFMMTSREVIQKIKGFDEDFFLFGEDIDISIRALRQGYQNYYIAEKHIFHFKGESMKKNWKHIFHFYNSMIIFTKKYYRKITLIVYPVVYLIMLLNYIKYFLFNKK